MKEKAMRYIEAFNASDEELYKQDVPNAAAKDFLLANIPLIDIPDETLERTYYFRWWVLRKHIKRTADGYVITEFLPPVPWAGLHNTIIAAAGFHIAEAKWLKCGKTLIEDYARFWLSEKSKTYLYSSWMLHAIYEYCEHCGDFSLGVQNLDRMLHYYETVEAEHKTDCGLFWSIDNNDAMEYSISGTAEDLTVMRGVRPTLNSYMAANALAIARFARLAGREKTAETYLAKHEELKRKINEILWDGTFFKAIHVKELSAPSFAALPAAQNARELIGYIPWCFDLAQKGRESAFADLKREDGFLSPHGLTTAERRHMRYLYEVDHECLWNGYVWPFATAQVLRAMERLLADGGQNAVTKEDFYSVLSAYARSHVRGKENGTQVPWIDEVLHPEHGTWSSREILENAGWPAALGGLERGKDYNHSAFCDIVLGGLLGIRPKNGKISVSVRVPDAWEYFAVENLWIGGRCYRVLYDKTGEKYDCGKGVHIFEMNGNEEIKLA